jgi:hypothetical protein
MDPVSLLGMIMIPPLLALERPIHFDSNASQLWAEPQRMPHGVTLLFHAAKVPPRADASYSESQKGKIRSANREQRCNISCGDLGDPGSRRHHFS